MQALKLAEGRYQLGDLQLQCHRQYIHLEFSSARQVLSSAVLGGGWGQARHWLNKRVGDSQATVEYLPADKALAAYGSDQGWQGGVVGMMTAASMKSLRLVEGRIDGCALALLLTTGLGNARRAGDPADIIESVDSKNSVDSPAERADAIPMGTINMALVSSVELTQAAMVEALMIVTEAKAAALQSLSVLSPVSGLTATGTGTDSLVVFNGLPRSGVEPIAYCGKHTRLGEWLGKAVIAGITDSVNY